MIKNASEKHIPQIAAIHCKSLPDDFLPHLGRKFLEDIFYPGVLQSDQAKLIIDVDEHENVSGFIVMTKNSSQFLIELIKKYPFALFFNGIRSSFESINQFRNNLDIIYSALSEKDSIDAGEIYIIAVDKFKRGSGIGKKLTLAGRQFLKDSNIWAIKIKTLASNTAWIEHFEQSGWELVNTFSQIGKTYVILRDDLSE